MKIEKSTIIKALVPLGIPKSVGIQLKYNCPRCEDELGYAVDKYNLEVQTEKLMYHCWACGQHGNLNMLIRKYGYKEFADLFKKSDEEKSLEEEEGSSELILPKYLMNIFNHQPAIDYLIKERGLTKEKVRERNIKFCYSGDYKNCIIFPSYDIYGKLNAFVSHNLNTKKYLY